MKLSEYKDEAALDLLVELIDPAADIFSDKEIADIMRKNGKPMEAVKLAIKNHKKSVIQILAILEGVPVEQYHCNIFTLPIALLNVLNDKDLMDFFSLQGQNAVANFSGSATETTEEKEQ